MNPPEDHRKTVVYELPECLVALAISGCIALFAIAIFFISAGMGLAVYIRHLIS